MFFSGPHHQYSHPDVPQPAKLPGSSNRRSGGSCSKNPTRSYSASSSIESDDTDIGQDDGMKHDADSHRLFYNGPFTYTHPRDNATKVLTLPNDVSDAVTLSLTGSEKPLSNCHPKCFRQPLSGQSQGNPSKPLSRGQHDTGSTAFLDSSSPLSPTSDKESCSSTPKKNSVRKTKAPAVPLTEGENMRQNDACSEPATTTTTGDQLGADVGKPSIATSVEQKPVESTSRELELRSLSLPPCLGVGAAKQKPVSLSMRLRLETSTASRSAIEQSDGPTRSDSECASSYSEETSRSEGSPELPPLRLEKEMHDRLMENALPILGGVSEGMRQATNGPMSDYYHNEDTGRNCQSPARDHITSPGRGSHKESRKRGNEEDEEDEQNDRDKQRRKRDAHQDEDGNKLRLACPFFKRNPRKYFKGQACSGPGFTNIGRVKEHIYRQHKLPPQCARCGQDFQSPALLQNHQRAEPPCQVNTPATLLREGITDAQEQRLRRKNKMPHTSDAAKWKEMYCILFPDADRKSTPSPYYDHYQEYDRTVELKDFQQYLQEQMCLKLPQEINLQVVVLGSEAISQLQNIIHSLHDDIYHDYLAKVKPPQARATAEEVTPENERFQSSSPVASSIQLPLGGVPGFLYANHPTGISGGTANAGVLNRNPGLMTEAENLNAPSLSGGYDNGELQQSIQPVSSPLWQNQIDPFMQRSLPAPQDNLLSIPTNQLGEPILLQQTRSNNSSYLFPPVPVSPSVFPQTPSYTTSAHHQQDEPGFLRNYHPTSYPSSTAALDIITSSPFVKSDSKGFIGEDLNDLPNLFAGPANLGTSFIHPPQSQSAPTRNTSNAPRASAMEALTNSSSLGLPSVRADATSSESNRIFFNARMADADDAASKVYGIEPNTRHSATE